jgi:hypothetical protein
MTIMTIKKYILYIFLYVYWNFPNFGVLSVIVIQVFHRRFSGGASLLRGYLPPIFRRRVFTAGD